MASHEPLLEFTLVEQQGLPEFPVDHALVGSILADSWWLPEGVRRAIRHHHDVKALGDTKGETPLACQRLIAVGHLAEHLRSEVFKERISQEWGKFGTASLNILSLEGSDLHPLLEGAAEILAKVE